MRDISISQIINPTLIESEIRVSINGGGNDAAIMIITTEMTMRRTRRTRRKMKKMKMKMKMKRLKNINQ
jgi:hypothetical protein